MGDLLWNIALVVVFVLIGGADFAIGGDHACAQLCLSARAAAGAQKGREGGV